MKKETTPELDKLFLEIGKYRRSSEFKDLFEFIKRFPKIATYNAMLLHTQKPGSQYVATASEWWRYFNRSIKPGARPLVILHPFGPVKFVFELSDTEGKEPFPGQLLNPFEVKGKITKNKFDKLVSNLLSDGILYREESYGTSLAGFIQTDNRKHEVGIIKQSKEIWVKVLYSLVVNRAHSIESKFATIAHELGHLYCGHLGTPNLKWWSDRHSINIKEREFEAESVCWLVCERLGIHNPSAEYLSNYLEANEEIPNISLDTILKAVTVVESMINKSKSPRKEIITRIDETDERVMTV